MPSLPIDFLRHTLATLAYRAEKALRDPPHGFEAFRPAPQCRPALAIVSHMGDLMEWGERMAHGERRWEAAPQPSWDAAVDRFFRALAALDGALAARATEPLPIEVICRTGSRSNASFLVHRTRDGGADRGVVFTAHIIRA
jgi:hypothetical protein